MVFVRSLAFFEKMPRQNRCFVSARLSEFAVSVAVATLVLEEFVDKKRIWLRGTSATCICHFTWSARYRDFGWQRWRVWCSAGMSRVSRRPRTSGNSCRGSSRGPSKRLGFRLKSRHSCSSLLVTERRTLLSYCLAMALIRTF